MYGSWVLLVLIFISSLPVIVVYIWFCIAKYRFSLVWFLFALLAGAATFFPALILQELFSISSFTQGRLALFFEFFVRVALTEELSRLFILFIFFWISGLISKENLVEPGEGLDQQFSFSLVQKGAATGLIAGLGFSILESARFAASSMEFGIILLRFFTAALHGACGSRVGVAVVMFRANPVRALLRVITATAIHGVYNFMVIRPGVPLIIAFLIAISALTTSIFTIRGASKETPQIP